MDRQPAVRISMEVATDGVTNPPERDYRVSGQMACKKWTPRPADVPEAHRRGVCRGDPTTRAAVATGRSGGIRQQHRSRRVGLYDRWWFCKQDQPYHSGGRIVNQF